MKRRSQRYDINRRMPTDGHKYTKYKICLRITMVISNIWSSVNEKVTQYWSWV